MGVERKTIRIFADVVAGFDPNSIVWNSPMQLQYHLSPPAGSRRLWMEIEIPADHEIWPEQFDTGLNLGRVGNRRIQMGDQVEASNA